MARARRAATSRSRSRSARLGLWQAAAVALAAAAALVPVPGALVERAYAVALYPRLQALLTPLANLVPIPVFDVVVLGLVAGLLGLAFVRVRAWRRTGAWTPLGRLLAATATTVAVGYLWFLGVWGLNYARPPLEVRLGVRPAAVTAERVLALARRSVAEVNSRYAGAHAHGFQPPGERPAALVAALHEIEARLGRPRPTVPSIPKVTVFTPFFRWSGTDGMLAPVALETLVNPDLTGPERAMLLAHEWGHLAGFAPEADASFVGVLATLRADEASRYSGWLFLVGETSRQVPRAEAAEVFGALEAGPRADLEAIRARLARRVDVVEQVSWRAYDHNLNDQGVAEGVRSYSRVVELLLGTGTAAGLFPPSPAP
ncbi:MAG: DUF3810 family protein [Vicinamibacterales bacterium]